MLVEVNIQNVLSFNEQQTFSMVGSTSTKESFNESNTIDVDKFGIKKVLKSASLFGANASGKSNFVRCIQMLKNTLLNSLSKNNESMPIVPFYIKEDIYDLPSELEVSFIRNNILYRYGISIVDDKIEEEWLYWTKNSRETPLFHREKQQIKYNSRSFSEAKYFVSKDSDGELVVTKTKPNIPFVSVLSQFNGEISNEVIDWFKNIRIISGTNEKSFKRYTVRKFENNPEFKLWALKVLSSFQIVDVTVEDEKFFSAPDLDVPDEDLIEAHNHLNLFRQKFSHNLKTLNVVKLTPKAANNFSFPLEMESAGTKKIVYMLGPIYDIIKNNRVIIIDEFDSKLHTLLSKYIINLFHEQSSNESQVILTTHDTNLLTKDLFRRDQIWFIEKNNIHESLLYSLLEYKELYTRVGSSYQKDYLSGKYGAIPLFDSLEDLKEAIDGEK